MSLAYTTHARRRMQQRGLCERDVELIVRYGTDVRRGLRLLRRRDIRKLAKHTNRPVQHLERILNCAVVMDNDTVITCYHLHGQAGRRALRRDNR